MLCDGNLDSHGIEFSCGSHERPTIGLARWLTEPGSRPSALLARVMVNRLWQHLFGRGLVPTPDNSAAAASRPRIQSFSNGSAANSPARMARQADVELLMTSTAIGKRRA